MMGSPMTMPGAFSLDADLDFSRPVAKPSFYIPPSPSASSVLSSSISKTLSSSNLHCRKRPRINTPGDSTATPKGIHRTNAFTCTSTFSLDVLSPAPLVNIDYRIAGGLDTPTAEKWRQEDQAQFEFEQDLRPNRYGVPTPSHIDGYFPQTPASANPGNRKRPYSSSPRQPRPGWGHTVWALTGGFAGKVFNFCWNSAFSGFHAGGGQGYHMQIDTPTVTANTEMEIKGPYDVFDKEYSARGSTPVPGGYPQDNFIEDYMLRPQSHQQNDTPTQHLETGDRSSLQGNWVMVNDPPTDTESSPARKRSRPSTANAYSRPVSRGSLPMATQHRMQPRSLRVGASYASPRAAGSVHAQTRPQSSGGFQRQHTRSRSSIAQTRQSEAQSSHNTPKSPEVVKFEKKLRKKDQNQDDSIRKMNRKMQDMIKEAQQALGSTVEVVDDVGDEGYEEGTNLSVMSRWE